ncbi:MAG: shikimate kinase [Actinobacteria bacterium BACL15 MAG-120619-bin91]|jgi:shikimate kinase|uniref:Shikimate kinase n=1 Tax=Actinobacteria bacterium BACL15 MAG-120619-bin91 TaxID=1655562 RepID=A0A0R2PI29_9ACTN|nr:MAG: shikimate kinase [Actinobacteria bacterium BACL15 MAG-120619-bin91]
MNRIVLIGPPGSGKSTVGAALAHKLNIKFVDTDLLIEQRAGKEITDIFVVDGEPYFRALELETLTTVLAMDNVIISLGGGAPVSEQAQQEIRSSDSTVIFLDVSLATAAPRVGFNRDRPLLLGNPRAQWQALSDKRRPIYEDLADLSVKVDDMSVEQIISDIELKLP